MNYQKAYDRLIELARSRKLNCYKEIHHIIPVSFGGSDDLNNLVELTAREHFIAHKLLWKIHRCSSSFYAYFCMAHMENSNQERYKITSREYEYIRKSHAKFSSNRMKQKLSDKTKHHNYGKNLSEETKIKISNSLKNRKQDTEIVEKRKRTILAKKEQGLYVPPNLGRVYSNEYKLRMSKICKEVKKTPEWNKKNSDSNSGRIHIANKITKERKRPKKEDAEKFLATGDWVVCNTRTPIPD